MVEHLRGLHLDAAALARWTHGPDDLRTPLTPTREATLSDAPEALAVRMLFCREPLPALEIPGLCESGLVERAEGGRWIASFHLRIVSGLYLFSDYLGAAPDAVMGAGETTAVLYRAARPGRRIGSAFDLGCGAGTLALLLARDAGEVLGADINPRAVALATFNAAVNGIGNVEFRAGDLFAPAAGRRFDLIVSQPPYYPGETVTFLHGGARGDELAERLVAALPEHLKDGGRGLVFTSWPEARELPASGSLRVLELRTNRTEPHGTRQSITVIEPAHGGSGWSSAWDVPADSWGHVSAWRIGQMLACEDLLHGPDEALLATPLKLPRRAVLFEEGEHLFLRCPPESLAGFAPLDPETWRVVSAIDRGEAIPREDIAVVRRAMRRGLLIPEAALAASSHRS